MVPAFMLLTLAFITLSAAGTYLSGASALAPVLAAVVIWGLSAWAFFPAQQSRLIRVLGTKTAPTALSLNASFMYLGFCSARCSVFHAPARPAHRPMTWSARPTGRGARRVAIGDSAAPARGV